jgi:hypothetical protein
VTWQVTSLSRWKEKGVFSQCAPWHQLLKVSCSHTNLALQICPFWKYTMYMSTLKALRSPAVNKLYSNQYFPQNCEQTFFGEPGTTSWKLCESKGCGHCEHLVQSKLGSGKLCSEYHIWPMSYVRFF